MTEAPFSSEAVWIASPVCGGPRTVPPAPYFRKPFELVALPERAILHITALGLYEAEINGKSVGDRIFAPGWTDYRVRVQFQTYDVTGHLTEGCNVLGVILGEGWYSGHVAEKNRQNYGDRPQLLARLEITMAGGKKLVVETGPDWTTKTGPILENDLIMGESYDARLEHGAWSCPNFDDAAWNNVLTMPSPDIAMVPETGPPVRRQEILKGISVVDKAGAPVQGLYDLQQNITGRLRITVRGAAGTTLRLRHGEILDEKGTLYTENLRGARAIDFYTLKGGGELEIYEPRFTFHGFRFFEVTCIGDPKEFEVIRAEGVVLHSDTKRTGWFSCSDPLINQLASNIVWGQKGNFLEVPTDCPQRDERLGWTGDAQAFVRTAAYQMNVHGFFQKWLLDLRDSQSEEGAIPPFAPDTRSFTLGSDGGPAWADAICICPWTIYRSYGDLDILRENYGAMTRYMDYLAAHKVKDGIRAHPDVDSWGGFGDWLALDGPDDWSGSTRKDLIGTAFYANNARILAETATLLGKPEEVGKWEKLHQKTVEAFQRRFVTEDGLVAGDTQTAYVLALHFDLLPEEIRSRTADELVRKIIQRKDHLCTGFVGTPYLLHVLERFGHIDIAYRLLEQKTYPSWLFPVLNGATTVWERWDGWTPERGPQDKGMNSYNHYAYGAVGDWLFSTVAGLCAAAPGYAKILFKPRPGGSLTSASARHETPMGETAISWVKESGKLKLILTVPPGAEAELSLPPECSRPPVPLAAGTHELEF